jgi:uncharacterized repeat protein (TIGR04076 family)
MSRYVGRVAIRVNGITLDSRPGAIINLGGTQRNAVVNDINMGFSEENKPSQIDCEVSIKEGDSFDFLRNMTEATCVFECDTGQQYVVRNAYTANPLELSGNEGGRVKLSIMGEPAEEVAA